MKRTAKIDWTEVHKTLERNQAGIERAMSPVIGDIAEAFRSRAERLARPATAENASPEGAQVVVVRLGDDRYGIGLGHISEIVPQVRCTPVPGAPEALAGVVQVRGEIVSMWNLARMLNADGGHGTPETALLARGARVFGLLVDAVEGIETTLPEAGEPPNALSTGLGSVAGRLITILDLDKILKETRI